MRRTAIKPDQNQNSNTEQQSEKKTDTPAAKPFKLNSLRTALWLVWKGSPRLFILSVVLTLLQAVPSTLTIYLNKLIIDSVVSGVQTGGEAAIRVTLGLIALTGGMMLLDNILSQAMSLVQTSQGLAVTNHIATVVHAKAIEVDLEAYENPAYYDTLRRVQQEAPYRPGSVVRGLMSLGQSILNLLAMVGLLIALHWGIALLLFVVTLPGAYVQWRFSGDMFRWNRKRTPTQRMVSYFNTILTGDQNAKEIRLFNLGPLFIQRYAELGEAMRKERMQMAVKNAGADFGARIAATLAIYGAYAFMAIQALHSVITIGALTMYYQAFQRGQSLLGSVFSGIVGLYEHSLYLSDLEEYLGLKPTVAAPEKPVSVPRPMKTGIAFENVRFQYPTVGKPVLEDISLTIRPGEMIALVGENGSGKTSLIKLLCRLYDPTEGRITMDGIDLRDFDPVDLRREISVIFQDYVKYQLTARENIQFGNVEQAANEERIMEAATQSGADSVIQGLKQGYDTTLGKWFDGGEELSIGQWQKIALARAFLRDSQLIVLDEPTSAMDARAEYELFRQFRQLAAGRAAVLISHRFSTVRHADCIYVLEHGQIIERGTHDTLMALNGTYARLFEMQAQHYR